MAASILAGVAVEWAREDVSRQMRLKAVAAKEVSGCKTSLSETETRLVPLGRQALRVAARVGLRRLRQTHLPCS